MDEIAEPMKDLDWLRSASLHFAVAKVGAKASTGRCSRFLNREIDGG
jgi:hypothetical protein